MTAPGCPAGEFPQASRFSVPVRDPVWKHIWLTDELSEITRSAPFLRLYRIKQLGPAEYVYPGATHSRASHSFGVYHVARLVLDRLIARGADAWVTPTGYASFLAAALLHDLGHFPFTHSLKELPLAEHERLTANAMLSEPMKGLIAATGADPAMAAAIVDHDGSTADGETLFFANILSGVLDPDKLDYLNRDAYFCGVPYGIQDTDFILSRIAPDRKLGIVIESGAIMSIESVLFSKYLMYRSVYWHRQVRVATAMMKKCLYAALRDKLVMPEELYGLDDERMYELIQGLDFPEKETGLAIRNRRFFRVIAEYPFNSNLVDSASLENLDERTRREEAIAERLSSLTGKNVPGLKIIVDVPERISFDTSLAISGTGTSFHDSPTVFTADVIDRFTSSLRIVRIAVHPDLEPLLAGIASLESELAKCLILG